MPFHVFVYIYLHTFQALHQLQTINGFSGAAALAAGTPVTSQQLTMVNGTGQPSTAGQPPSATAPTQQTAAAQTTNPYQGANLTAATPATAQPMSILALQQLLASTGQSSLLTNGAASGKNKMAMYVPWRHIHNKLKMAFPNCLNT